MSKKEKKENYCLSWSTEFLGQLSETTVEIALLKQALEEIVYVEIENLIETLATRMIDTIACDVVGAREQIGRIVCLQAKRSPHRVAHRIAFFHALSFDRRKRLGVVLHSAILCRMHLHLLLVRRGLSTRLLFAASLLYRSKLN